MLLVPRQPPLANGSLPAVSAALSGGRSSRNSYCGSSGGGTHGGGGYTILGDGLSGSNCQKDDTVIPRVDNVVGAVGSSGAFPKKKRGRGRRGAGRNKGHQQ